MKSRFLAILIILSVVNVHMGSSQSPTPTASVSLSCDTEPILITHLYEYEEDIFFSPEVDYWGIENQLYCTLHNPTAYIEVIEVSIQAEESNELITFDYDQQQEVGAGEWKIFTTTLTITEGLESVYEVGSEISFDVNATVVEIAGLPPSNSATSGLVGHIHLDGLVNNSLVGKKSPMINGSYLTEAGWYNFDYESLFNGLGAVEESDLVWVNGSIDAPNSAGFTYEEWLNLPPEEKLYENASGLPVLFHGNGLEFTTVTDQFGEFSQRLPAGMTFNINAQSSVSNWGVGSLVTVTEGMSTLDALVVEPSTTVLGAVYLYDLSNKYDSNLFEYKPLTIHAISDSGVVWKTNIDTEGEFSFPLADGIWSFDIEFHDAMVVENYLVDYETMNSPNNFVDTIDLVLNSNFNADLDLSTNPYIGIQFADIDCDNFEDVDTDLNGFQPSPDRKKLFLHYNNSENLFWSSFDSQTNEIEYFEERDNGEIDIDLEFVMNPILDKRLLMDSDGLFRGSFSINVQGDWTNDNDGNTACGQNDCEELNITLMAGPNIIGEHHETGLVAGDNTVVFNFMINEETIVDWDKGDYNPVVKVEMKLRGNYQTSNIIFASGEPASFTMKLGELSYIELPILNESFECDNKELEMKQWSQQFDYSDITNQEPNVMFLTSVADTLEPVNSRGEIVNYRQDNQHQHIYIDDLDNENYELWQLANSQNYALIQPDGKVAWTSFGASDKVAYSQEDKAVIVLKSCLDVCTLEEAIIELIDAIESEKDSDNDGVPDADDLFPYDSTETSDTDGDGVGDNGDAFPNDSSETTDSDGDGIGNNADAFPQDGNETHDDDGDGVGNNSDAFPQDANETMDSDSDGVGDNADPEPDNPDVRTPQDISVEISDTSSYILAGAIVFLALVIIFVRRKAPPQVIDSSAYVSQDSMWNDEN
tara:strand:+ start:84 stop:2876 length:2793 start_codon:yes stop_codon:yes gene_type:complete